MQYKGSLLLELQQRALEFNSIIEKHQNIRYFLLLLLFPEGQNILPLNHICILEHCLNKIKLECRSALVERMPVLDEATYSGRRGGSLPAAVSSSNGPPVGLPNGVSKPAAPLVDLLDLSSDDVPAPNSSGGGDFLNDLLGVDLSLAPSQSG